MKQVLKDTLQQSHFEKVNYSYGFFSSSARINYMSKYESDNNKLAKDYFNRNELFLDSYKQTTFPIIQQNKLETIQEYFFHQYCLICLNYAPKKFLFYNQISSINKLLNLLFCWIKYYIKLVYYTQLK